MTRRRVLLLLVVVVSLLMHPPAGQALELFEGVWQALDVDVDELQGAVLGGGVLLSTSRYKGIDDAVWGVPIIVGKYKRFYSDGTSLGYFLTKNKTLNLSVVAAPRFGGYDASDSDDLAGMQDRDWSLDGGLRLTWDAEYFLLNVTALTDVLNEHNGHEVKAVISREFLDGGFTPRLGIKWLSSNIVEYYYGVAGGEATANRPAYEGDATIDMIVGCTLAYPLGEDWALFGDVEFETLGSEIKDSPIVDADDDLTTVVGVVYRF